MLAARSPVLALHSNKPGLKGVAQRPVSICVRGRAVSRVLTVTANASSDEVYKVVKLATEDNGTISIQDTSSTTSGRNDSLIGSVLVSASAVFLGLCILYAAGVSPPALPSLPALPSVAPFTAAPEQPSDSPSLQPSRPLAPAPAVVAPPVLKATTTAPAAPAPAPQAKAVPTPTQEEVAPAPVVTSQAPSSSQSFAAPSLRSFSNQANTPKAPLPSYPDCYVNMC